MRQRNRGLVEEIRQAIARKCADAGIKAETTGREKKPYAIWSKMEHKQISLEQLSDIYGFRVIVDTIEDCYRVLGIVHTTWSTVPGRFKDYISAPKRNNYQSDTHDGLRTTPPARRTANPHATTCSIPPNSALPRTRSTRISSTEPGMATMSKPTTAATTAPMAASER